MGQHCSHLLDRRGVTVGRTTGICTERVCANSLALFRIHTLYCCVLDSGVVYGALFGCPHRMQHVLNRYRGNNQNDCDHHKTLKKRKLFLADFHKSSPTPLGMRWAYGLLGKLDAIEQLPATPPTPCIYLTAMQGVSGTYRG